MNHTRSNHRGYASNKQYRKPKKKQRMQKIITLILCLLILWLIVIIFERIDLIYTTEEPTSIANNNTNIGPNNTDQSNIDQNNINQNTQQPNTLPNAQLEYTPLTFATDEEWFIALVNKDNPLTSELHFEKTLLNNGEYVATAIYEPLMDMMGDGEALGLSFIICSGYRSYWEQESLFYSAINEQMAEGYSYEQAYIEVQRELTPPSTSEHQLGLAVDIVSADYQLLDELQATTPEAIWLAENCHRYGFIVRYPRWKTHITGIIYEPWHFRYVGIEHATKIMESGLTLEEYLAEQENR